MVKLLFRCFLLASAVFGVLYGVGKLDNFNPNTNSNVLRVKAAKNFTNLDFLFIGPSYTYNGIDPCVFDSLKIKSFNLGIATAGPYFYEIIIDDYLESSGSRPKTILISFSYLTFFDESDNWNSYPIHRYLNAPLSNEYIFIKYASFGEYMKMLRKSFFKGTECLLKTNESTKLQITLPEIIACKGFINGNSTYNEAGFKREVALFLPYKKAVFCEAKAQHLLNIIKKYQSQNINVILHEIPNFKLKDFFSNQYKQAYLSFKNRLKEENIRSIERPEGWSEIYFGNIDHLNNRGAQFYTRYLIEKLRKIKVITN